MLSVALVAGCSTPSNPGRAFGKAYNRVGPNYPYKAATSVAVSPDGKLLAAAKIDCADVWDIESGRRLRRFKALGDWGITDVVFLDDDTLLTAGRDHALRFWSINTGQEIRRITQPGCWFTPLAVSPDRKTAASLEEGGKICIWDLQAGRLRRSFAGQADGVQDIVFLPDGKALVTSSNAENAIVIWDIATGKKLQSIPAETFGMAVSPDGERLAFRKDSATIVWNLKNNKPEKVLAPLQYGVGHFSFTFSPNGRMLAAAELGGDILIWDLATGKELADYDGPDGDGLAIVFSRDGKTIFSGGHRDTTVRQWPVPDLPKPQPPASQPAE